MLGSGCCAWNHPLENAGGLTSNIGMGLDPNPCVSPTRGSALCATPVSPSLQETVKLAPAPRRVSRLAGQECCPVRFGGCWRCGARLVSRPPRQCLSWGKGGIPVSRVYPQTCLLVTACAEGPPRVCTCGVPARGAAHPELGAVIHGEEGLSRIRGAGAGGLSCSTSH